MSNGTTANETNNALVCEQPRLALSVLANQKRWQWVSNEAFYRLVPGEYYGFYQNWVRLWLYWYDGYVPWVHGGQYGLLSTGIGTTIVNRAADSVFGGNVMFANARKPTSYTTKDGKPIGAAMNFIANKWSLDVNFKGKIKRAIKDAFAGGFSLLKLNKADGELWLDALRADRFYLDKTGNGKIRKVVCILSFYDSTTPSKGGDKKKYCLIEERRYEKLGMFGKEIPIVEYKIYDSSVQIQYLDINDNFIKWEDLPKNVREAFKAEYDFELNRPQAMNGFTDLGCYLLLGSDDVSNVPQVGLGESLLANILTYLYEYDFYNTCFNTDMYLARGRVLVPKPMQSPQAATGAQNSGLDDFLYTKVETLNTDQQKPEAIQFELRSAEWKEARNMLLECMATSIGISVSTLASYLQDGSNRTAREVSAEENATTLFVENARRRFEAPINEMLKTVLRFYGYKDDIEVRWSRSGMTNITVLVDTLSRAVDAGLISQKKAHHAFNYDDDEEQNEEDYKLVEQERSQQATDTEEDYMRYLNDNSQPSAQPAGDSGGGSGDKDQKDGEGRVLPPNAEERDRPKGI